MARSTSAALCVLVALVAGCATSMQKQFNVRRDDLSCEEANRYAFRTMRNLGYGSDVNGIVYHADDIINETLHIEDGYIHPPPGPGLGVSLNRDKVEQYRMK